jgi:hypothetical protein
MKKLLTILLALVASVTAPGAGTIPEEALGAVNYDVRYKLGALNTKVATATITWEKADWKQQPAYHSHALVQTTPVFKIFLGSDYTADTYLSQKSLAPLFFSNPFKDGSRVEYVYNAESKEIESLAVKASGEAENKSYPLDGRTMDLLSLLHYLRFHTFSAEGSPLSMHLLMGGISYAARVICQGPDETKFPDKPSERIVVEMTEHGLMENGSGNKLLLWRSNGPDRRILGLEVALSSGTMICRIRED